MGEFVRLEVEDGVGTMRLDRPKILDAKEDVAKGAARYQIELGQIRHDGGDWQPA